MQASGALKEKTGSPNGTAGFLSISQLAPVGKAGDA
jgi:hypothetical protein